MRRCRSQPSSHPPCLRETPACWTVEGATIRETRMPCIRPAGHPGFCCACTPTGYEAEDAEFVRMQESLGLNESIKRDLCSRRDCSLCPHSRPPEYREGCLRPGGPLAEAVN